VKNILEKELDRELSVAISEATAGAFLRGPSELLLPLAYSKEVYRG
jgi:hypothetical protein